MNFTSTLLFSTLTAIFLVLFEILQLNLFYSEQGNGEKKFIVIQHLESWLKGKTENKNNGLHVFLPFFETRVLSACKTKMNYSSSKQYKCDVRIVPEEKKITRLHRQSKNWMISICYDSIINWWYVLQYLHTFKIFRIYRVPNQSSRWSKIAEKRWNGCEAKNEYQINIRILSLGTYIIKILTSIRWWKTRFLISIWVLMAASIARNSCGQKYEFTGISCFA